jgi:preprotein translocase subunit SecD
LAIVVLAALAFLVDWPKVPPQVPGSSWFAKQNLELGLDLRGGSHLVYQADMSHVPSGDQADAIQGVRDIIDRRVSQGLSDFGAD